MELKGNTSSINQWAKINVTVKIDVYILLDKIFEALIGEVILSPKVYASANNGISYTVKYLSHYDSIRFY